MNLVETIRRILAPRKEQTFRGCAIFPLGASFEQARHELQLSQKELADLISVAPSSLKRLQLGEVPSPEVFRRIAHAFKLAAPDLPCCRAYLSFMEERFPELTCGRGFPKTGA